MLQRITQICHVLGKSDETLQRTLQGSSSIESLDAIPSENDHHPHHKSNRLPEGCVNSDSTLPCDKRDPSDKSKFIDNGLSQTKSDSESGFDESCSNMSRSGIDDCNSAIENGTISRSTSLEKLNLDQLKLELDSVALEWKSFRNIFTCSCAFPFDHFTKKASFFELFSSCITCF